ncbi:MAG: hypothetical protein IT434_00330 [Phycisphaerales bacterium]|jgi:hypothetical protein|nr:hypothetical protein [Phycisphaerales bacterium]
MNNIQLYVVLFMVVVSILSSIAKKAKEAAEQRRVQQEIERRRLEALRTGRSEDDAREEDPAATLAKRREAQLEELRRVQRERARAQASGQTGGATVRTTPGRMQQPRTQQFPQPQSIPQPQQQGRPQRQQPQRPQPQRQQPQARPQVRPQESRSSRQTGAQTTAEMFAAMERQRLQDTGESTTHRIVRDATPAPAAAAKVLPPSSGNPWRDAFLLQELLSPPLSMREARTPGLDSL